MRRFIAWKQAVINRLIHRPWIVAVRQTPSEPAFNPADMFTPTTPGWVYDLSDFSTLFQDSAGITPVTAAGQPVGLMLDKSKGLELGPDIVTPSSPWSVESGTGLSIAGMVVTGTGGTGVLKLSGVTTIGERYQVVQEISDYVSGSITGVYSGSEGVHVSGNGEKPYLTDGSTGDLYIYTEGGFVGTLTITYVKLLAGNHASQPTTTKRPVLKVDGNGKYYLQGDGVDDFMSTAAIDFTGSDSVTTWTGVQKLQDATRGILYELGTDTNAVNGTFSSNAPESDGGTGFGFASRGTSRALANAPGYAAPYKAVLTAQGRISTDTALLQVNLNSPVSNGADQGINAYISAPAYFGARAGTSLFFNGQLYSAVCLGRVATTEELDQTRTWVNDRTGAY